MTIWGVSALSHDASLAVVTDGEIKFAAHAERYSRKKGDPLLHPAMVQEALRYGEPSLIAWYERPTLKRARYLRAGQWTEAFTAVDRPRSYIGSLGLRCSPRIRFVNHHLSHGSAGFATSGFDESVVIVADAIGEWRTLSISYYRRGERPRLLHKRGYPHSLGLLYSAFTRRCGFRPNEEEYIVMGLAATGEPRHEYEICRDLIELRPPSFRLKFNPHRGIGNWLPRARAEDLAASIQRITERVMVEAAAWAHRATGSPHLIFMGGMALNCVVNSRLAESGTYDKIWIFPNPGDAGSSVGAAAFASGSELNWRSPYLGTDIPGPYPVATVLAELQRSRLVGVAAGRAEFGPRALGNRSLLADPTVDDMQALLNSVKGREPFRPFAPVVRAEIAHELFDLPVPESPYMQYVARCREPDRYPGIVHVDGTSRVQTVRPEDHRGLHDLLTRWECLTGSRLLLNTSLNIKGEPLANDAAHARAFAAHTGVRVACAGEA